MANVKSETFTTADGTVVRITVNGQEFRVEGRRPTPPHHLSGSGRSLGRRCPRTG